MITVLQVKLFFDPKWTFELKGFFKIFAGLSCDIVKTVWEN